MILLIGGIKGGVGKTSIAVNLTIMRSLSGHDTLLIDGDDQESAFDFSELRAEAFGDTGAGYSTARYVEKAIRREGLPLSKKFDTTIIDVGGRDTSSQRAALSIADVAIFPFQPGSFDVWTIDRLDSLVEEAKEYNENLQCFSILNRADSSGEDNEESAQILQEAKQITYIDSPIVNRKVVRNAASKGLSVAEFRPKNQKSIDEMQHLYDFIYTSKSDQNDIILTA
ncbi:MAG: AAA family ATPase [Gammaproteobacteria bacterium]|jgi:chromosome partitioning protein|nr:AAA family ATPase [Gammaproteobacteria bacterium]MBT6552781.1 AAA family ATPase [Gammaproteobacteria bacterium]